METNMNRVGALEVAKQAETMRSLSRAEQMMYTRAIMTLVQADTGHGQDSLAIMHLTRAIQWNHQSASSEFFAAEAPGSHTLMEELERRANRAAAKV